MICPLIHSHCLQMFSPLSRLLATSARYPWCHWKSLQQQSGVVLKTLQRPPTLAFTAYSPLPDSVMSFPFPASHFTLHLWDCSYLLVFIGISSFLLCLPASCSLHLESPPLLCLANTCFPFKTQCKHHFLHKAFPDHHCPTVISNNLLNGGYTSWPDKIVMGMKGSNAHRRALKIIKTFRLFWTAEYWQSNSRVEMGGGGVLLEADHLNCWLCH